MGGVPAIRLSRDLRTWTERPAKGASSAGTDVCIAGTASAYVIAYGPVFRSADGRTWTRGSAAVQAAGKVTADCVTSDGTSFIAWTMRRARDGIWTSADGRRWTKVHLPGARAVIIDAVAPGAGGGFAVAGRAGATTGGLDAATGDLPAFGSLPGRQAVWTSTDGRTWAEVPVGGRFDAARISSIASGGPGGGIVALVQTGRFGQDNDDDLSIETWRWTRAAGWQQVQGSAPAIDEQFPGTARIVATRDRWLLLAGRTRADLARPGVTAISRDGKRWQGIAVRHLGTGSTQYFIDGCVVAGRRLVLVVNMSGLTDRAIRIWVSPS
ncbi:MAG: hypothetical protein WCK58_10800 [Chloroflexota bacterium]